MNFIDKMVEQFMKANRRMKRWQRVVSVLAAIVVFITTYSLVLPAITLDKDTASTQAGIEVAASDNEAGSDGTVFEAEPEEEPVAEEPAEEPAEEAEEPAEAPAVEESGSESESEDAESAETADNGETAAPEDDTEEAVKTLTAEEAATYATTEEAIAAVTGQTVEEVKLITEDTQLVYNGSDYKVYADFGKSAKLPEGVELKVREITKESDPDAYQMYYEKALSEMQGKYDENTSLSFARFYDISFVYEGVEIEPSGNVNVRIEYKKAVETESAAVDTIHFDKKNDEKAEVIDSDTEGNEKKVEAVEFKSDQFSVYGIVGTETIIVPFVAGDGSTYEVTVNFDKEAGIPENAQLEVTEVTPGDNKYDAYLAQTADAINSSVDNLSYIKLLDIKILDKNGNKVALNAPVDVQIKLLDKERTEDTTQVVHFEGTNENPVVIDSTVAGDAVSFSTDGFSVYAVVDEGADDEARMTVNFYNGDDLVAYMIVKNGDKSDEERFKQILYDPGIGDSDSPAGVYFKGWTKNKNYTVEDANNALTIEDIRNEIKNKTITEGDVLNLYAANVRVYNVTYLNEHDITIGADTEYTLPKVSSVDYTVTQAYTPDETSKFEGWNVSEGANNIPGHKEGTVYKNGTNITITGDVVFSVNAPKGQWLVFHENKGTYVAPQFIKTGDTTNEPDASSMQRTGYTFDGWYTKDGTNNDWGEKFIFGRTINDRTHVYAKWTANKTADYTILIWKQNTAGNGYDFAKSLPLNGTVGENIGVVSAHGSDNTRYARINDTDYRGKMSDVDFTGFHLSTSQGKDFATDQGTANNQGYDTNVKIKAEGGSILNVYYDRNEITLDFLYYDYNSGRWYRQTKMTGLYGQKLPDKWPTNRWWYDDYAYDSYYGYYGTGTRTTFMDAFLPSSGLDQTFYGFAGNGNNTVHWLKQNANDNGYTEANSATMGDGTFYITDKYNGFRAVSYSTNNSTWTRLGEKDSKGIYAEVSTSRNLYIRFDRLKYSILYRDGVYVDGNNNPVEDAINRGQLKVVSNINYESSLSSYNKGGSNYYDPTTDKPVEGFVFEGWYIDDACTQPYTFTTMPEGITVYAKWRQVQYRVFLHPNAGTDSTLTWGSDDQSMNFRISYGGKVSTPTGKRDEYEFVGWFTDPEFTNLFDGDAYVLNETTVTTPYNKNVDMTDPMDKWGNGATTNADVNRAWITKKLDLYGRWRAMLKGANGIGIIYDANGGSGAPSDDKKYLDQALAPALEASQAPEGQRFLYWVVQKWNGSAYEDTEDIVYPGDTFTVLKANAREEAIEGADPEHDKIYKTYTVQLRAEYGLKENETKTHITWFANNGSGDKVDSTNAAGSKDLQINEAVGIKPADTFKNGGRKFLGWARLEEDIDEETGEVIPKAKALGLGRNDLWLIYDEQNERFILNDGSNRVVSKVAADEVTPYHDLYAVWAYRVTVKKVVESPFDADKAKTNVFNFSASKNDGISKSTTFELSHNTKEEYVFDDVAYGGKFSVSETLKDEYDTTLEGAYTDLEGKEQTLTGLTNGGNIDVKGDTVITVTNKRKTGTLTISKTTNPESVDSTKKYKVSIAAEDGKFLTDLKNMTFEDGTDDNKWHEVTVGKDLTIENIPAGTYTVVEDTTDEAVKVEGYRYDGTDYKVGTGDAAATNAIATVNAGETTSVAITNKYTKLVDISVTKTLVDEYAKGNESFSFSAKLTEGTNDITSELGTLGEGETEYKFTLEPGEKKTVTTTFAGIPVGATLKIEETAVKDYKTEVSVNGADAKESTVAELEIVDGTNSIVFTNTRKVYVVDFKKTAEDGTTELSKAKFTLGLSNGSVYEVNDDWNMTLGKDHLTLPLGSYELSEQVAPDGYVIMNKTIHFQIDEENGLTVEDVYFEDGTTKIATKENAETDGSLGTISIKNQPGKALPNSGGSGTILYTLSGLMLILVSAMMYGFRMRRGERRIK